MNSAQTQFLSKKGKLGVSVESGDSVVFPVEIITEILLRLDVKPLFRNKCISKQWNSIISDPNFGRSYMERANKSQQSLWGYLPRRLLFLASTTESESESEADRFPSLYLPNYLDDDILASSNGLLLCGGYGSLSWDDQLSSRSRDLCVWNPLTKQSIDLPRMPVCSSFFLGKICLATRYLDCNSAYVSYKVVFIKRRRQDLVSVKIYSSDTKRWRHSEPQMKDYPSIVLDSDPLTCKGILHWFDFGAKKLVTYDPFDSPDRFSSIDLPSIAGLGVNVIHMGQPDVVKFGEIDDHGGGDRRLNVWRLYKGGWSIEQMCLISPSWDHRIPEPRITYVRNVVRHESMVYFCYLGVDDAGHEEDIIDDVRACSWGSYVPYTLCPWAWTPTGTSTGTPTSTSFRKASPRWVPPRNKYRSLIDWACSRKQVR